VLVRAELALESAESGLQHRLPCEYDRRVLASWAAGRKMPRSVKTPARSKEAQRLASGADLPDRLRAPDVRVVFGLLGQSEREDCWRLYLSLAFDECLEFAKADVLHSGRLSERESQVGGTVVWLRRNSNPIHIRFTSREAQADFLHGEIARRLLHRLPPPPASPMAPGVGAFVAGGYLTGGDFDTLCAACTAVPTALIVPGWRARAA